MEPRLLLPEEFPLLRDFLYLAIHVPDGQTAPPRDVVDIDPLLARYWKGFGRKEGDVAVCSELDGRIVGVAWTRILGGKHPGYGHIDDKTPEIAIAVLPEYRGLGIGEELLTVLLYQSWCEDKDQVSLSVDKDNPARHLYERLGFTIVEERGADLLMVKTLAADDGSYIGPGWEGLAVPRRPDAGT